MSSRVAVSGGRDSILSPGIRLGHQPEGQQHYGLE